MYVLIGFVVVLVLAVLWAIRTFNRFQRLRVTVDEAESGIDVALTKRYDMLTKMVDTVKGFVAHEKFILPEITRLRSGGHSMAERNEINRCLDKVAGQINVAVEAYPELRSAESFMKLKESVADVEKNLQAARRLYNSNVSTYNQAIIVFPASIIANMKNHTKREFFEAEEHKRQDVKIDL